MTRVSTYGRRLRMTKPLLVPLKFARPGSKPFTVMVERDDDMRNGIIEEYNMLGWELV